MTPRALARTSAARTLAAVALTGLLASGCSLVGEDEGSVFGIEPGQCFLAPEDVEAQIGDLDGVDCDEEHDQESYAVVGWESDDPEDDEDAYPGDAALARFADGACAAAFGDYVGVDYLDSDLFFTYLAPSPRSWQEEDRQVICFVTAAGRPLTGSVKGTEK